jgi:FdhD protein
LKERSTAAQAFLRIGADGDRTLVERDLALEVPIALEFNGFGYAVLMATPSDLEDLTNGFLLSERILQPDDPPVEIDAHGTDKGIVIRANLPPERANGLFDRVRHRTSDSSCGLCGIENLDQAMRPLPRVTQGTKADDAAVFLALANLGAHQALNARTGAAHAAALVDAAGGIRLIREDVGRHNAFDKLIGAMHRSGAQWDGGFALLSSRCSFELVEKAALADCPLLVTISAPTSLAVERARSAGLDLRVLARSDSLLALGEPDLGPA